MVDRLEFALYANIICCKRIPSYLWKSPTEIIFLDNLCNQLGLRFWIKQDLHQQKNNQIIYLNIFCRNSVQFSNPAWDHRNYHWNESSKFIWKRPTECVNPEPSGTLMRDPLKLVAKKLGHFFLKTGKSWTSIRYSLLLLQ